MFDSITTPLIFAYFLVFCRIGSAIMLLPGLSEGYISPMGRLVAALGLTGILVATLQPILPKLPSSGIELILLIAGEIIIGTLIGSIAKIIVSSLHVAGSVISYQSGLASANLFDPTQGTQSSAVSAFLTTTGLLILLVTNMHHLFLAGLVDSYKLFAPGNPLPLGGFTEILTKTFAESFAMGIKIAAPQIVIGMLLFLGAGVMSRLMPQMQVFFVMMPLQIILSFFILMITFSTGFMWFIEYYGDTMNTFIGR